MLVMETLNPSVCLFFTLGTCIFHTILTHIFLTNMLYNTKTTKEKKLLVKAIQNGANWQKRCGGAN